MLDGKGILYYTNIQISRTTGKRSHDANHWKCSNYATICMHQ